MASIASAHKHGNVLVDPKPYVPSRTPCRGLAGLRNNLEGLGFRAVGFSVQTLIQKVHPLQEHSTHLNPKLEGLPQSISTAAL